VNALMGAMTEQQKIFGDSAPLAVEMPKQADVDLSFFAKAPAS
jgi:hypothetical protein